MNRRKLDRVPLDTPCFATLHVLGKGEIRIMISDLSLGGARLALPSGCGPLDAPSFSEVYLSSLTQGLLMLEGKRGRISWVGDGCCGIQFENHLHLSQQEFQIMLDKL